MKKNILTILPLITLFLCWLFPLRASHLDGLWRNERQQITLRIEQDQDGFRAKRTDQGIWYHYTTNDNQHFTDRYGNWYELVDDEELIWNEANSPKRIYFTRVYDRDDNQWNNKGNNYTAYGNSYNDRFHDDRLHDDHFIGGRDFIEGYWYAGNGRDDIQIISFAGGIKVKSHHDGWEKFYTDRTGNRFRDRYNNTIVLIDRDNLRYRSQHGNQTKIFTRHRNWNPQGNRLRD